MRGMKPSMKIWLIGSVGHDRFELSAVQTILLGAPPL